MVTMANPSLFVSSLYFLVKNQPEKPIETQIVEHNKNSYTFSPYPYEINVGTSIDTPKKVIKTALIFITERKFITQQITYVFYP